MDKMSPTILTDTPRANRPFANLREVQDHLGTVRLIALAEGPSQWQAAAQAIERALDTLKALYAERAILKLKADDWNYLAKTHATQSAEIGALRAAIARLQATVARWEAEHEDYKLEVAKENIKLGIRNTELKAALAKAPCVWILKDENGLYSGEAIKRLAAFGGRCGECEPCKARASDIHNKEA